jgi:UTP--glucose-1-phosphate uridylyltransferase
LNAEHLVGDEPFIYTFADDFIVSSPSRFKQMIDVYKEYNCSVLTCIPVTKDEDYSRYGIVAGSEIKPGLLQMSTIIEKPGKEKAPSNLASVSGYLLTPEIFRYLHLAKESKPEDSEFYIQPAMQMLIEDGGQIVAYEVENGTYYDTGNKLEYLKTVVDFALKHEDIKDDFMEHLRSKLE